MWSVVGLAASSVLTELASHVCTILSLWAATFPATLSHMSCGVLHDLQLVYQLTTVTDKDAVAIIQRAANKRMDECRNYLIDLSCRTERSMVSWGQRHSRPWLPDCQPNAEVTDHIQERHCSIRQNQLLECTQPDDLFYLRWARVEFCHESVRSTWLAIWSLHCDQYRVWQKNIPLRFFVVF